VGVKKGLGKWRGNPVLQSRLLRGVMTSANSERPEERCGEENRVTRFVTRGLAYRGDVQNRLGRDRL